MKEELRFILLSIYDLQKFAEAKNAGLAVLNSAILLGILSVYSTFKTNLLLNISVFIFFLSIFISLISQFPNTDKVIHHTNENEIKQPNIFYFGHLAIISVDKFLEVFKTTHTTFVEDNLDISIIEQIIYNSKIAFVKFEYFKYSSFITLLALGFLGIIGVIEFCNNFINI